MTKRLTLHYPQDVPSLPDNQQHPPPNIIGHCTQCGKCCAHYGCPCYDETSKQCRVHNIRPIACRIWPGDQDEIDNINCTGYSQQGL